MAHTPGPWGGGFGRYIPITAIVDGKSAQIGRAESFGQISDAECEANAALMIAAPDLLAALRLCRAIIGSGSRGARLRVEPEAIAQAEAAIAKAEGRG